MRSTATATAVEESNRYHHISVVGRDVRPSDLVEDATDAFVHVPHHSSSPCESEHRRGVALNQVPRSLTVRERNTEQRTTGPDVARLPENQTQSPTLHALQQWEGYVLERTTEEFTARLVDITGGASREQEEAVIPLAELADHEAAKATPGAIFRWVIGYERAPRKPQKRVSVIVFRDLPVITESDRRAGVAWAEDILQAFKS